MEHSFDVVSQVNLQEVKNAVQQTLKEIGTRFDFKGSKTQIKLDDQGLEITSTEEMKLKAAYDVLETKLVKRHVSLKALQPSKIEAAFGGTVRQRIGLQIGIPIEKAREIVKLIKGMKLKVQASIQGDQVRVSGKKKDELQSVIELLRDQDMGINMQFINYR